MRQSKLFVAGDLCVDVSQEGRSKAVPGEEHELKGIAFSAGGCAANFSVISGRLGLKPVLVSAIGDDFAAPLLKKELSKAGVRLKLKASRKPNAVSLISLGRAGDRAIQSVTNCLDDITAADIRKSVLPGLSKGDLVYFGGFFHLKNIRRGFAGLLRAIRGRSALVCFDACFDMRGEWDVAGLLPLIDYLFLNEKELMHLSEGGSAGERAENLLKSGAGHVILKRGSMGSSVYCTGSPATHAGAVGGKAKNTTGAGDAFNAGFLFGVTRGWTLRDCALAGNFVAARTLSGGAGPKPRDVAAFVERHGRAASPKPGHDNSRRCSRT